MSQSVRTIAIASVACLSGCAGYAGSPTDEDPRLSAPAIVRVDPPAAAGAMAANLAPARGGAIATWLEPTGRDSHRLRFSRFARGSWSQPVTIAEGPRIVANWADVPSAAETAGGVVVAHWAERRGDEAHAYDVMLARSADRGATWRRLGPAHDDGTATEHGFVTLVPEGDKVRAVWLDGRETARDGAMTLRTALVGDRVDRDQPLDDRVCDCCSTSAARTGDGLLLAYRDRSGQEVRDISAMRLRDGSAAWSRPASVHRDGWRIAGCPVNGPVTAAAGRLAAVAWYTYANRRHSVRVAFSRDGGKSFAPAIEVDGPTGSRAPLGRVGLVLDRGGEALVSWVASEREQAEILVRRVAPDGRLGRQRRIARTRAERRSGVPRMVAVGDQLLVAWTESGEPTRVRAALLPGRAVAAVDDRGARALPSAGETAGPGAGELAPNYRAESLTGQPVDLASLRGKVVLLNLWATWCVPCRQELVDLAALHRERAGHGLAIVAVSVDDRDSRDEVTAFADKRKLPFTIWLDPDDRASRRFGVRSLPTTLLVGRDGTIRWRRDGVLTIDEPDFRRALDRALSEQ